MLNLSTAIEFPRKTKQIVSLDKRKRKLCDRKGRNGSYQPAPDSCYSASRQPCARSPAHQHAPSRADPFLLGGARSHPPDLKQQLLVGQTDHTVNYNCSKHSTYPSSHDPYRLVADSHPIGALPEPPSRLPPFRPPTKGGPPQRPGLYFRQLYLQSDRSTSFSTSPFSLHPVKNTHVT